MNDGSANYNLLDEKWIPVLYSNGTTEHLGVLKVFENASCIREIACSNPMDRVAVLRFLLALLYWCRGNPPQETSRDELKAFPREWFAKLESNRGRFNLLGDGERFYQYRKAADKPITANYLIHEVPTGRNSWHFRHATEKLDGLCPACCALGLTRLPAFSTSAGRGKPPGINSKPPLYAIPIGGDLVETLWLSWKTVTDLGIPSWEKPDLKLPKSGVVPLLTGLTWLPRRVWLSDPEEPAAACISCGREGRLIRQSVFGAIGSAKTPDGEEGRSWLDPHVIYIPVSKDETRGLGAANALRDSDAAARYWTRVLSCLLRYSGSKGEAGKMWIVGFSTVQNDKYLEAREQTLLLPVAPDELRASIEKIEQWQMKAATLARRLAPRDEKRASRNHKELAAHLSAFRPSIEYAVSSKTSELLMGDDDTWERASEEYGPMMRRMASALSPGFTTAALRRRMQMGAVRPDMRPKIEDREKPEKKGRKK